MSLVDNVSRPGARSAVRGFTLIELMIVVAIAGILAAVAYPSYQSYIRKTTRADATSLLQSASLAQEKFRLGSTTYASATTALSPPCPTVTGSTCSSERQHYTLAISGVSGTGYTLTANAASSQQTADTGCTAITLTVSGGNATYGPATCWSK